ncbi:hypothetical protein [Zavarzinella formosa]|uniref:hypothetical protein n=1 Tax=Zavarzinella formosa TaxID=360055 RepID=UPI000316D024|nr:hypothetical protein [Zavarzinella formosa]
MKEVVRAKCPKCQNVLSIPAEWADRTIKCKHCGHQMQARRKTKPEATAQNAPKAASVPAASPVQAVKPASPVMPSPTWEPLPEYTPLAAAPMATAPVRPATVPAAAEGKSTYVTAFDTRERYSGRGHYKGPKSGAWIKYAIFGVLFLGVVGGAGAVYKFRPDLFSPPSGETPKDQTIAENKPGVPANGASNNTQEVAGGIFPRRMLAISIHSYLYANPLHNGEQSLLAVETAPTGTDANIRKLADRWRIPNEQVYHLTDAPTKAEKLAAAKTSTPKKKGEMTAVVAKAAKSLPLKMVMEGAITNFADSSREQDRVVFVFCGHAYEKDGKAFLLPLEGDFEEPETMIPLEWFYEKVAACKAQEKLVIFDVARFHPDRGLERPHPGVMSEGLEKALHDSPEGVSVLTTCSKGEYSYEVDYFLRKGMKAAVYGGFFLSMIQTAGLEGFLTPEGKLLAPTDPLPAERLVTYMSEKVPDLVKDRFVGKTQTPKVTLKHRDVVVKYDPNEAVPGKVAYPVPPPSADPKMIASILREIEVPSVKSFREDAVQAKISDIVPFKAETLKEYEMGALKADDTPDAFQKVVLAAVERMRKLREAGNGNELPESFVGETSDAAKNQLKRVQEVPANVEVILREHLEELENIASMKEAQTKRWQANYDYILAQVKFRICYAYQYNLALANVRGGKVPDLTGDQNGYRLTAEVTLDKNTAKEYKVMFDEARKSLNELVKNHPQTPWALLSKADRTVAIGLRLTPTTGAR